MKPLVNLIVLLFVSASCSTQVGDIASNEIYHDQVGNWGVKAADGTIVIEPVYAFIRAAFTQDRNVFTNLPQKEMEVMPYYVVRNQKGENALYDEHGQAISPFFAAQRLAIDPQTETVVVMRDPSKGRSSAQLYSLRDKSLDDTAYESIGFFEDSELIILEQARDSIYLYDIAAGRKLGPYDHFNLLDSYFAHRLHADKPDIADNQVLGLSVRWEDSWGMLDMDGNELFPMTYASIRYIDDNYFKHPAFRQMEMPEDVSFVLSLSPQDRTANTLLMTAEGELYEIRKEGAQPGRVVRKD